MPREGMVTRRSFLRSMSALGALAAVDPLLSPLKASERHGGKRPNIVFFYVDQHRRDSLGFMGVDPVLTPHLDAFAKGSAVFTNAYCTTPLCTPARAALYTGRYPAATGVINNGCQLSKEESRKGIGYALREAGYSTGYIGKYHLGDHWKVKTTREHVPQWQRAGFEFWYANNLNHSHFVNLNGTGDDKVIVEYGWQPEHETDVAMDFIANDSTRFDKLPAKKRDPKKPFALFINFSPPHNGRYTSPEQFAAVQAKAAAANRPPTSMEFSKGSDNQPPGYIAPEKYRQRYEKDYKRVLAKMRERGNFKNLNPFKGTGGRELTRRLLVQYFGAVTAVDDAFGRLLKFLDAEGLADNTIVVFSSDHGEMLGAHGRKQKHIWYDEAEAVPLMIRWPGAIRPARHESLTTTVDSMPTLLDLAGVKIPKTVQGKSLAPLLTGKGNYQEQEAVYYCFHQRKPNLKHKAQTGHFEAVRTKTHLYVEHFNRSKLKIFIYDLKKDPYQLEPILKGQGLDRLFAKMAKLMAAKRRATLEDHDKPNPYREDVWKKLRK